MDFEKYTDRAKAFVQAAQSFALRQGHQQFGPDHLLKVLLDDPEGMAAGLVQRAGGRPGDALQAVELTLSKRPKVSGGGARQIYLAPELARTFNTAQNIADKAGDKFVTVERLLLALAMEQSDAARVLKDAGANPTTLNQAIDDIRKWRTAHNKSSEQARDALNKYARNLSEEARAGEFELAIGREEELRRIIEVLLRRTKNNPVLIGEPDVGIAAIVEGLAWRMSVGDVPDRISDKELFVLDIGALSAGTKYSGEFDDRLKALLSEINNDQRVILVIFEVENLINTARPETATNPANLLRPAVLRGQLQCICITTPGLYKSSIETDAALSQQLHPVFVAEPNPEDTVSILRGMKPKFELHHAVRITDGALVEAVRLSKTARYLAHRFLPAKAIDLIDEAAARLRMRVESKPEELDALERHLAQLQIDQGALADENDAASKDRLQRLEKKIAELQARARVLSQQWSDFKKDLSSLTRMHTEIDAARAELTMAQRRGDLQRAGELLYAIIPALERKLKDIDTHRSASSLFFEEAVTKDHIADVIARWTGVPVADIIAGNEPAYPNGGEPRSGRIFISYRRDDAAGHAGRVHDRLEREFGRNLLFMDVDAIPLGVDFAKVLGESVASCDVLLALIGPNWLNMRDDHGNRRLDNPNDFVRIEIAVALQRGIALIPILLDGTILPDANELPEPLQGLSLRQGLSVRHVSFHSDMDKLIRDLKVKITRG